MEVTINGQQIAPRNASIVMRIVAFFVDLIAAGLLTGIPSLAVNLVLFEASEQVLELASVVVGFLVFTTYHSLVPVAGNGRTAGMFLCGIRVVDAHTLETPSTEQSMKRGLTLALTFGVAGYVASLMPFYLGGPLAMALLLLPALANPSRRALHDLAAGTRVIQQRVQMPAAGNTR